MKKKGWCTILLLLLFPKAYCQKPDSLYRDDFSFEADANYNYYLAGDLANGLNYGFSFYAAKYINKLKLSAGINYSEKTVSFISGIGWTSTTVRRVDYKLEYTNIPILIGIEVASRKHFALSALGGMIISRNTNYEITSYYTNGQTVTEKNLNAKGFVDNNTCLLLGNIFTIPLEERKPYHGRFVLNLVPFISYKVKEPRYHPRYGYQNLPGDRIMIGFKVGIEYLFRLPNFTRITGF